MAEGALAKPTRCPCGTGLPYAECCGPLHSGGRAPTAEALMRSRYSAFVVKDADYLLETWHPDTRPSSLDLDDTRWYRLAILGRTGGGPFDASATVEFEAFYRGGSQHENSTFVREGGRWLYHSPAG